MNELFIKLGISISAIPEALPDTSRQHSLAFLRTADDGRSAAALYTATRSAYGLSVLSWEPETLWLSLQKDGIDLSVVCRDKLQAALTVVTNPQFYWDHIVFENTVHAFMGTVCNPDVIQECHPSEMSWGVYEADIIRGMDPEGKGDAEFDEDVQQYIAVCLVRAGFVCAPDILKVVDDNLADLLPDEAKYLRKEVKKAWEDLDKGTLRRTEFVESPLGVNLARLAGVYAYMEDLAKDLGQDFMDLKGV